MLFARVPALEGAWGFPPGKTFSSSRTTGRRGEEEEDCGCCCCCRCRCIGFRPHLSPRSGIGRQQQPWLTTPLCDGNTAPQHDDTSANPEEGDRVPREMASAALSPPRHSGRGAAALQQQRGMATECCCCCCCCHTHTHDAETHRPPTTSSTSITANHRGQLQQNISMHISNLANQMGESMKTVATQIGLRLIGNGSIGLGLKCTGGAFAAS